MNHIPKAILFDLDGVLVNGCDWHYTAFNDALEQLGFRPISYAEHLRRFNGLPTREKMDLLRIPHKKRKDLAELKQIHTEGVIEASCRPDPVKVRLLTELSSRYRLACCSNCIRSTVSLMLEKAGLNSFFELILSNQDVTRPKPFPDIYEKAFECLGVNPWDCVIVEDSPKGITAAKSSGARVIAAQYPEITVDLFKEEGLL